MAGRVIYEAAGQVMRLSLLEPAMRLLLRYLYGRDQRLRDVADLPAAKLRGEIRNILLVSCTALGDTLLSSPAFHSLRLAYPDARIVLLGHPAYRVLYDDHPDTNAFIAYDGSWRHFASVLHALRNERFDLACILHGNEPQITPLCYLAGIRFIFKLPNVSRYAFLLSNREPQKRWDDFGHGIEQRLEVAFLAGGVPAERCMTLVTYAAGEAEVEQWLAQNGMTDREKVILFQPGASTASRRWAPSRFIELGTRLRQVQRDVRIVLTGSPSEAALCKTIASGIGAGALVSAGVLPLKLLPALIRRSEVLVTGDTGPMHLAVAMETPVVALFAVSDFRRSGPAYGLERHVVIQKWRTCDPCLSKRCPYPEPLCMENISVDEVFTAIGKCLERTA